MANPFAYAVTTAEGSDACSMPCMATATYGRVAAETTPVPASNDPITPSKIGIFDKVFMA